jgi:HlyD family secretion protein
MISKTLKRVLKHKVITGIILAVIIAGGYFIYHGFAKNSSSTQYVTAAVEKGTLIVSVSGSGQVSASDQLDIKSKTSGDIVYLGISKSQSVKKGQLLLQLDTADAKKAIEEADIALQTAKLDLEDLQNSPDQLSLIQAENSLTQAQESKQNAQDNLAKSYEDAFNEISNVFMDLPPIDTVLNNDLYSYDMSKSQENLSVYQNSILLSDKTKIEPFVNGAVSSYEQARDSYDKAFAEYKATNRYADKSTIEDLLNNTAQTVKLMSDAARNEIDLVDYVVNYLSDNNLHLPAQMTQYQSDLKTNLSKLNSDLSGLSSSQNSIQNNKDSIVSVDRTIEEKQLSLDNLKQGPTDLDIRSKQLAVQQKQDALTQANENLSDCYIYAPFDGVISGVNVKKGDSISSGTAIANIITDQRVIDITLNEVDAAKVKVGQKATITFDALPNLSMSGQISEVDTVGSVSQGVVSYGIKITLDVQNEDIKPGMSATADIVTDISQNALILPNSAVKSQGNSYYVELVKTDGSTAQQLLGTISAAAISNSITNQTVEVGLSNDTSTEIVSGLQEGDIVVSSTVSQNSTSSQTTQTRSAGGFQIRGGNRAFVGD